MSNLDELEKLHKLYQKKLTTKKEYDEQREKLLAQNLLNNGPKSRLIYILLALFLGIFGIHNFYAGYWGKGLIQLLLTLFSFFLLSFIVYIWVIVEVVTIKTDASGQVMREG